MADNAKGDDSTKQEKKSDATKELEKKNAEEPKEQELVRIIFTNMSNCSDLKLYLYVRFNRKSCCYQNRIVMNVRIACLVSFLSYFLSIVVMLCRNLYYTAGNVYDKRFENDAYRIVRDIHSSCPQTLVPVGLDLNSNTTNVFVFSFVFSLLFHVIFTALLSHFDSPMGNSSLILFGKPAVTCMLPLGVTTIIILIILLPLCVLSQFPCHWLL